MKTIIAGSRWITDYDIVVQAIAASGWVPTLVIEGGARGVDRLARQWAEENGTPYQTFYAAWDLHGHAAGPIRNREMAAFGDALIAIPQGESKGTRNMVLAMQLVGKPVFIYEPSSNKQGSSTKSNQREEESFRVI